MKPALPPPYLIVDPWGFRLADPDGNLLGRQPGVIVTTDSTGAVTALTQPPGIIKLVEATPIAE